MKPLRLFSIVFFVSFLIVLIAPSFADSLTVDFSKTTGGFTGRIVQLLIAFTVLSIAPAIVIVVTSFTRLVIVFSFLRNAMGLQQSPPNMVLASLALFLTGFIMATTLENAYNEGIKPLIEEKISESAAIEKTITPFHQFMLKNVREKDLKLFINLSKSEVPPTPEATPLRILVPAFMISELRKAFEIGFMIFLPFLIIDLVVASVLMAMGMMMLPPTTIALPFKVIFFVLVDGWYLMCGSLIHSFR